ncbi:hypothetical protein ACH5RR_018193 [Cinchona calisaya]|uniref:non-specific serine/threonine protein kinase n=1 Tax=Cinchona calisaya TaxID=153742 RepID=A0ABD2ZLB5_9GENT
MEEIYYPLAFLLLSQLLSSLAVTTTKNITTDQLALDALKAKITSEPHQILANNWSDKFSVCLWIGVTCGSRHHRVTALNISKLGLTGSIPPQLGNLSFLVSLDISGNNFHGQLPHELIHLRRLRVLNLTRNNLSGELPSWFGSLQELQYLSIRNNSFTGFIPPSITNLSKLETLILSFNPLQGKIPMGIGNINKLRILSMKYNQLSGSLPFEIFNISSLEILSLQTNGLSGSLPVNICRRLQDLTWLDLSDNKLSGLIPSTISQCSKLRVLGLSFNSFNGPLPKEFGNLKVLEKAYLGQNNLNGTIPQEVGDLHNLKLLDMGNNMFTGSIPRHFGNLSTLAVLYLNDNKMIGTIPQELGNLQHLEGLVMSDNSLTGSAPVQIFNISTLLQLSLGSNDLSGNLPSTMGCALTNLIDLYLNINNFQGQIPSSISNASKLINLALSTNEFSGPIPNSLGDLRLLRRLNLFGNNLRREPSSPELSFLSYLTNCKYLNELTFGDNPLYGVLPISIGNLSTSLEKFTAYYCEIKGKVPEEMGNLSNLLIVGLAGNNINGPIPITIKGLQKLQGLDFSYNQISGSIPDSLCELKSFYGLYLYHNQIHGSIPSCLSNISSLREISFGGNSLNSAIPTSLWNLSSLLTLDLSSNSFSCSLPEEIQNLRVVTFLNLSANNIYGNVPSSIGSLQSLTNLSIAQNKLEGPIPDSLGHILSLELLDLSNNNLSGSIPKSLEKLSHLNYINLSFNHLRGEIPSSGPFKNFTYKSFMSNDELCGARRFHVPPCSTSGKSSKKRIIPAIWILSGVAVIIIATTLVILFVRYRKKDEVPRTTDLLPVRVPKRMSYYELFQATNGYDDSNLLGIGSFGSVYKGILMDGALVAVKVFNLQMTEVTSKSFDIECEVLRNLRHRNLNKVIGSCSNFDFKALVLDFMPNGSLEKWLYSHNFCLDLMQRVNIVTDVACALQYLHHGYTTPVCHCDLKPSNILLDENMVAHVNDFGVSKFLDEGNSLLHTKTLATMGYMAPEYGLEGLVSTRVDVYSFGIILMETFSRKKPSDDMFSGDMSLKHWIEDALPNSTFNVIDANLLGLEDKHLNEKLECVSLIFELALKCCTVPPRERTNMIDVVAQLEKIRHQIQRFSQGT